MMSFLFSPSGRISRKQFWLGLLGLLVFVLAVALAAGGAAFAMGPGNPASIGFIGLVFLSYLVLAVSSIMLQIKRLHDLNKSGFWLLGLVLVSIAAQAALIPLLDLPPEAFTNPDIFNQALLEQMGNPVVLVLALTPGLLALAFFIYTGFFRGTVGANRFGEDPTMVA